jgi:hypothetical protein
MPPLKLLIAFAAALLVSGCHSPYVAATLTNRTTEPLSLLELDYPSASFGTQSLPPGQSYHYRFKVLGSGPTTLLWTDSAHHDHKVPGPALREGDEGTLTVAFPPGANPAWDLRLLNRVSGNAP